MALFALLYRYVDDPALVASRRPEHRAYLQEVYDRGNIVVAGPLGAPGPPGALVILDVDSADDAHAIADADPFTVTGVVAERSVHEWTLPFGADRLITALDG